MTVGVARRRALNLDMVAAVGDMGAAEAELTEELQGESARHRRCCCRLHRAPAATRRNGGGTTGWRAAWEAPTSGGVEHGGGSGPAAHNGGERRKKEREERERRWLTSGPAAMWRPRHRNWHQNCSMLKNEWFCEFDGQRYLVLRFGG